MTGRGMLSHAAWLHGWTLDEQYRRDYFTRGVERIDVQYDTNGRVLRADRSLHDIRCEMLFLRDNDKCQTVLAWMAETRMDR